MNHTAWLLIVVAACFHPTFHDPTCGPNGECPSGMQCVDGTCRTMGMPGDDADVTIDAYIPDATECTAQVDECLTGTDVLRRCDAPGTASYDVTCGWGCRTTPTPHCLQIAPSGNGGVAANGVMPGDVVATAGLLDITLAGGTLYIDTDMGRIGISTNLSSIRGAGSGIISGIDYQLRGPIAMFRFKSLTVTGGITVRVTGTRAAAFVANGNIVIDGIVDVRGMNETPGPGGFAGAMGSAQDGMGVGAGQGKAPNAGGGAGHGARGGDGDGNTNSGGVLYGDAAITLLRGGSGGASGYGGITPGRGGGGGGALQLVSNSRIQISAGGGINAGGQGGSSATNGEGGGGGAGGALLLEAPSIIFAGTLAVNGGGGGATNTMTAGGAGTLDRNAAQGAINDGGDGGVGNSPMGRDAMANGGGGGGAIGRIRFDTRDGTGLTNSGTLSPNFTDPATTCTQGSATLQ